MALCFCFRIQLLFDESAVSWSRLIMLIPWAHSDGASHHKKPGGSSIYSVRVFSMFNLKSDIHPGHGGCLLGQFG